MAFDNYAAQDLEPLKELPLHLYDLKSPRGGHPTVHCVHAGDGNDGWTQQTLLDARGALIEMESIEEKDLTDAQRDERRKAFEVRTRKRLALHCIRRLENVQGRDETGAVVDVSDDGRNVEEILAFMLKIPWFVVRKILMFVTNESNWQLSEAPAVTAEQLAKK